MMERTYIQAINHTGLSFQESNLDGAQIMSIMGKLAQLVVDLTLLSGARILVAMSTGDHI